MKKIIISSFILLIIQSSASLAQLKINYGFTFGMSRNFKNTKEESYNPYFFNNKSVYTKTGYTSPVFGLHSTLYYKLLYMSVGVEYNQLGATYYSFNERGYNSLDAQNNVQVNKYFDASLTNYQYRKLNIPIALGIKILNKHSLSPFIYGGLNINYILNGNINTLESFQDAKTKEISTRETPIEVLDKNDGFELMGSRKRYQRMLGIGLHYKNHLSIKATVRSQLFLYVTEKSEPNNQWDCFAYIKDYSSREYLLTLQYHF